MAEKMGCPLVFELSDWADVRISRGENGSFLFINNYQDDPIETTIEFENELLLGGNAVCLAARTGAILPVEWKVTNEVVLNYCTSEITGVKNDESSITLTTQYDQFVAELSLTGYECEQGRVLHRLNGTQHVRVEGTSGEIILRKR
jgi:beta-galactosidase